MRNFPYESICCLASRVVFAVPADRIGEESIRRRSDTGKSREFQLQVDARVLLSGGRTLIAAVGDEAPSEHPQTPAARAVFEAGEALQRLVVVEGMHVAGEEIPVLRHGPGGR